MGAALDADLDTAVRAFGGTAADRRIWAAIAWRVGVEAFDCDGETVSAEKLDERARRSRSRRSAAAEDASKQVTPDMQVTCPNCGTTFRVGRRVAA